MLEAIILAGGLGTRLRASVPDLPKPMAPINGKPFLEHQMDYWIHQGVTRFVISVGYMREKITTHFSDSYRGVPIVYAEESVPLGTGGGLLLAYQKLIGDHDFIVMNGDTFFEVNLKALRACHLQKEASITLALFKVGINDRYMGVDLNPEGYIHKFKVDPQLSKLANGGIYMMRRDALNNLPWHPGDKLSLEDDLFQHVGHPRHQIAGLVFDGGFIDIGVPEDYQRAATVLI